MKCICSMFLLDLVVVVVNFCGGLGWVLCYRIMVKSVCRSIISVYVSVCGW